MEKFSNCISSDTSWTPNAFLFRVPNETNICWTMDKRVWQSDAIFHSGNGKNRRRKKKRKDIVLLEKTRAFRNQRCLSCFPKCFVSVEEETKRGDACSQKQASPSDTSSNTSKENKGCDMSMEKSPSLSRKRKNFLSSQKRGYLCFSFFCWTNHKKRKPSFCPKKICGKTKEENPKRTKTA